MAQPLISVCIPVYNREKLIVNALEYAISQDYPNLEILVADNCSTDSTVEIIKQFQEKDKRISLHLNDTNIGACANLNRCVKLAEGEYIKFLLSDDIMTPTCTSRMIEIFQKYPSVKLVACREDRVDDSDTAIEKDSVEIKSGLIPGRQTIKDNLYNAGFITNFIATPTGVMFRKADFGDGFDPTMHWALDLEMWLRMLLKGGDYYRINEPLALARDHKGSSTSVVEDTLVYIIHDLLKLRNQFAAFMQEEGVKRDEWNDYVDRMILDYLSNRLKSLTAEQAEVSTKRFINMVGQNKTEEMVQAMLTVIFYLSTVLVKPVDELRKTKAELAESKAQVEWYKSETERLVGTVNAMAGTLPWKMTQPLRALKAKLSRKSG